VRTPSSSCANTRCIKQRVGCSNSPKDFSRRDRHITKVRNNTSRFKNTVGHYRRTRHRLLGGQHSDHLRVAMLAAQPLSSATARQRRDHRIGLRHRSDVSTEPPRAPFQWSPKNSARGWHGQLVQETLKIRAPTRRRQTQRKHGRTQEFLRLGVFALEVELLEFPGVGRGGTQLRRSSRCKSWAIVLDDASS